MVNQIDIKIQFLEVSRTMMESKIKKLGDKRFDGVLTKYLEENKEYLDMMKQLFGKVTYLDQKRLKCRVEFEGKLPGIVH